MNDKLGIPDRIAPSLFDRINLRWLGLIAM
jgi:hypothetical protein